VMQGKLDMVHARALLALEGARQIETAHLAAAKGLSVREAEALPADGIFGSRDRSALLAAIVARRRGLPGPSPEAVLACQHKPTSRRIQQGVAPEAVPRFGLVDAGPPFAPPFFVKPVAGRLSQGAREVRDAAELPTPPRDAYAESFERMTELAGAAPLRFDGLLAEHLGVEPAEVAAAVAYLLGRDGASFTGAALVLDGGWTAR